MQPFKLGPAWFPKPLQMILLNAILAVSAAIGRSADRFRPGRIR